MHKAGVSDHTRKRGATTTSTDHLPTFKTTLLTETNMADKLCLSANSVGNITSLHSAKHTNHSIICINVKKNNFVQLIYLVYIVNNDITNKGKLFLYSTNF